LLPALAEQFSASATDEAMIYLMQAVLIEAMT
jgi:hypothetical protein